MACSAPSGFDVTEIVTSAAAPVVFATVASCGAAGGRLVGWCAVSGCGDDVGAAGGGVTCGDVEDDGAVAPAGDVTVAVV